MKTVALLSGGLDSTLAIKLILDQGIEVIAINFITPFCLSYEQDCGKSAARKVADNFKIGLEEFNVGEDYIEVVKNPKHGYGKNLNPCIDCRIFMNRKAHEFMFKVGASFIITGEVLGQRPMSQYRKALELIDKESDLEGLILRPLSAKLLTLTIPEKEGWVNRERLLSLSGRTRRAQLALAKDYNIVDYSCVAGGCLLTDVGFSQRMKDLLRFSPDFDLNDIELLKVGRHFRISPNAKLVVGRDETENIRLLNLTKDGDVSFTPYEVNGPLAIGRGKFEEEPLLDLSSSIIARYCDGDHKNKVKINIEKIPHGNAQIITGLPLEESLSANLRI